MKDFFRRSWAEINLDSLAHNYNIIKNSLPDKTEIMAVVKADAYGHGADYIARELTQLGVSIFAVSNLEEAISLRNADIKGRILILGPSPYKLAKTIAENNIEQTVHSIEYANLLNEFAQSEDVKIKVHIKVDTGMGRIGFNAPTEDFIKVGKQISEFSNLEVVAVFSHFSHADADNESAQQFTNLQVELFKNAVDGLRKSFPNIKTHLQNSAGILDYSALSFDYARPGIIMYGLTPSNEMHTSSDLHPVMELKSCVIALKTVEKGTPIGYGRKFIAIKDMVVATVPIGYADGYSRRLSSKGIMLVRGKRAKVIGNVCMDQLMLDVTDIKDVTVDDVVTIYGQDGDEFYGVQDAADAIGTISYELICLVNKRVPRVFIKNNEIVAVQDLIVG